MRLALLTLRHVWLRLWHCRVAVVSLVLGAIAIAVPAVKDLFLEPRLGGPLSFAVIVLLFWAIPIHRSARAAVASARPSTAGWSTLEARLWPISRAVDKWLPRVLGLLPFVILMAAIPFLYFAVSGLSALLEYQDTITQLLWTAAALLAAVLGYGYYLFLRRDLRGRGQITDTIWRFDRRNFWSILAMAHTVLTVGFFVWAVLLPLSFTGFVGRVALLPVLLGGPLPFLTPVAGLANRTRVPLIVVLALLFVAMSALNERFHDVRTYEGPYWAAAQQKADGTFDPQARRLTDIDPAIDAWMKANGCEGNPDACPEAVLVAATGGGSRAAFFTASVLGALLDLTRTQPSEYDDLGKAIFAMSGVSGGSVGITLTRAALADAADSTRPPCTQPSNLWFGTLPHYKGRDVTTSWRACLQALAAGDLVSAPIVGLAYRDYIAPPIALPDALGNLGGDRNVLLEQALEQHYNHVVGGQAGLCGQADVNGLCRPLGYRNGDPKWLPLLLLNGTSVDRGSAIIASDLNTAFRRSGRSENDLVPFTHSIYELLTAVPAENGADEMPDVNEGVEKAPDLRLSTAAIFGARFPGILTAGNIRNIDGQLVERVVDGGYFDNSGLGVLGPIHRVLVERRLRPIVIMINNEPWDDFDPTSPNASHADKYFRLPGRLFINRDSEMRRVKVEFGDKYGAIFLEPIQTLNNIRGARGEESERDFVAALADERTFFRVRVTRDLGRSVVAANDPWCQDRPADRLTFDGLVVSWWLSPVAQRFVDAQLCSINNRARLEALADALRHGIWSETPTKATPARTYSDVR